jgi:ABC-type proline/glycine betaine transport system permease subunit
MKEASSDPDIASKRSDAQPVANGLSDQPDTELRDLSLLNEHAPPAAASNATSPNNLQTPEKHNAGTVSPLSNDAPFIVNKIPDKDFLKSSLKPKKRSSAPISKDERSGSFLGTKEAHESTLAPENTVGSDDGIENEDGQNQKKKRTFVEEFRRSFWLVLTHSWFNVLLVFVPLGIILANIDGINSGIVFAMNCIAVIPLAGLLAFATESVAVKMGDALGALLNVTFGNAVELIIFIIALVKNEIRIVQASLLGSILANLLLILGMGFFLGGLRFREQVYNSTVTQMSACLLSLSVISLVLPVCSILLPYSFSTSSCLDDC